MAKRVDRGTRTGRGKVRKKDTRSGRIARRRAALEHLAVVFPELPENCEISGLTMGRFSMVDLLERVLELVGPADVAISVWIVGLYDVEFLDELRRRGLFRSVRFLLDAGMGTVAPGNLDEVRRVFGDDAVRLSLNHAKFFTARTDTRNIVFATSCNMNENRRIENFELSDCRELCGWLEGLVDAMFQGQTTRQTFRRSEKEHRDNYAIEWV